MNVLNKTVKRVLVENLNTEEKALVLSMMESGNKYWNNYLVLALALGEDVSLDFDNNEMEEFYGTSIENLTNVDMLVMRVIKGIQKHTKVDVKALYEEHITLDTDMPELQFLASSVYIHLGK